MPQFKKMRQTNYCINTFGHEKANIKQMQIHGSKKNTCLLLDFVTHKNITWEKI